MTPPMTIHHTETCVQDNGQACEMCQSASELTARQIQVAQATAAATQRTFPDILNQWTNECLLLNKVAVTPTEIALITRLGTLGQRLLYEANAVGMGEALKLVREHQQ